MKAPPSAAKTVLRTVTKTVVIVIVFDFRELMEERKELTREVAEEAAELTRDMALLNAEEKLDALLEAERIEEATVEAILVDSEAILVKLDMMIIIPLAILLIEDVVLLAMFENAPETVEAIR